MVFALITPRRPVTVGAVLAASDHECGGEQYGVLVVVSQHVVVAAGISSGSQCSMTGVTKAVVCAILSVGWCI